MNRTLQSVFTAVSVTVMSGLAACGGDDSPTGPGKVGSGDQSTAAALAYGVVGPLVRDVLLEDYVSQVTRPLPANSTMACSTLTICDSGTVQYCIDSGTLSVTFSACRFGQVSVDGSVTLALQTGTGSGSFDLTVGGNFHMTGTISYMVGEGCFSQSFSEVTLTTGDYTIDMSGFAQWCDPRVAVGDVTVPNYADFNFYISSLNRHINVYIGSEPPGAMQILVQNLNQTENILLCDGNITGSSLDCNDPNY
jgi:hypothetical protein